MPAYWTGRRHYNKQGWKAQEEWEDQEYQESQEEKDLHLHQHLSIHLVCPTKIF
jgi:hypothetical protein